MSASGLAAAGWAWIVDAASTPGPDSALFGVVFVHLWLGLAIGRFGRARTTTWTLLVVGLVTIGTASFVLATVLPWGQARFALAARADGRPFVGPVARGILALFDHGPADVGAAIGWGLLVADMAVAYLGLWRGRTIGGVLWRAATIVALALVVDALATPLIVPPPDLSPFTPMRIVPPWFDLPLYAVLRCIPDKLAGVALAVATALVPALWALVGRARRPAVFWPLWLAVALVWVGLGAIGERPPDDLTVTASRMLVIGWFAFFLLGPLALPRFTRGGRAETSD